MGSIDGTVENPHIRVSDRSFHACLHKCRSRGKYNVTSVCDGLVNILLHIIQSNILIIYGSNFFRERLFQMKTPKFMGICPGRRARGLFIDKRNLKP